MASALIDTKIISKQKLLEEAGYGSGQWLKMLEQLVTLLKE